MSMEYRFALPREELAPKATVKRITSSANEIELDVEAPEATVIYVSTRWAEEWRQALVSSHNTMAVDVAAGRHSVFLTYQERELVACLVVTKEA